MKYLFNVTKQPDEDYLKTAFEMYFENKNEVSLIFLAKNCLAYALCFTPLDKISLEFKDFQGSSAYGFCSKNALIINNKLLTDPTNENSISVVLFTIFHELCHAIVHERNLQIIKNRKLSKLFFPNYDIDTMQEVFSKLISDKNLARAVTEYFYIKNENEQIAFLQGANMAKKLITYFAPNSELGYVSGESMIYEMYDTILERYPNIADYEKCFLQALENYQLHQLSKGLDNLTFDEKSELIKTTYVNLSENVRKAMLNQCYCAQDEETAVAFLSNPMLKLSYNEKRMFEQRFGKELIDAILFKENIFVFKKSK